MVVALLAAALSFTAAPLWTAYQTTHREVIESEPFVITARLPEGWTVDDGRIVPPEALRATCTVTKSIIHDREWKSVVADALREFPEWRELKRVGGHEAAEYRTRAGSRLTDTMYINLESLEPVGVATWRVEAHDTAAGRQCQFEFSLLAATLTIDRPATQ